MTSSYYSGYGGLGFGPGALGLGFALFVIIMLVVVALKGFALWHAAKRDEKWWFIILLVVNTMGILELVYILAVAKVWPPKSSPSTSSVPPSNPSAPNH